MVIAKTSCSGRPFGAAGLDAFAASVVKRDEDYDRTKQRRYSRACGTAILPVVAYVAYFVHRARCLAVGYSQESPGELVWSAAFLAVEVCFSGRREFRQAAHGDGIALTLKLAGPLLLDCAAAIAAWRTLTVRPKLVLAGDYVPSVDVFITCRHEPTAILLDTVRAACVLDYPVKRYRIIVLDDGNSQEARDAVNELQASLPVSGPRVWYTSRGSVKGGHGKKYNMQHGLDASEALPGGKSAVAAFLDVDMIPDPWWLRVTVPHLVASSETALVNPPQDFYNFTGEMGIPAPLDWFFEWHAVLLDSLQISLCTGSGIVLRRSALDQVGGFCTPMKQEDVAIPKALQAAGWESAQVDDEVQCGLMPEGLHGQVGQRKQWIRGWLDDTITHLTKGAPWQKILAARELCFGLLVYFIPAIVTISLSVLTLAGTHCLLIFRESGDAQMSAALFFFARVSALGFGLHKANASSWRLGVFDHGIDNWLWPLLPEVLWAAISTKPNLRHTQTYRTAGAVRSQAEKKGNNLHNIAWRYTAVLFVILFPICLAIGGAAQNGNHRHNTWPLLMPPQALEMYCDMISHIAPVVYGIYCTPSSVYRESLLVRNAGSLAAYPLKDARHRHRKVLRLSKHCVHTLAMVYTTFCLHQLLTNRIGDVR